MSRFTYIYTYTAYLTLHLSRRGANFLSSSSARNIIINTEVLWMTMKFVILGGLELLMNDRGYDCDRVEQRCRAESCIYFEVHCVNMFILLYG